MNIQQPQQVQRVQGPQGPQGPVGACGTNGSNGSNGGAGIMNYIGGLGGSSIAVVATGAGEQVDITSYAVINKKTGTITSLSSGGIFTVPATGAYFIDVNGNVTAEGLDVDTDVSLAIVSGVNNTLAINTDALGPLIDDVTSVGVSGIFLLTVGQQVRVRGFVGASAEGTTTFSDVSFSILFLGPSTAVNAAIPV